MMDEGYIKFKANWEKTPPFATTELAQLIYWRQRMFDLGLIGMYENGIGFGNISQRIGDTNQFFISASKTGNLLELNEHHFAKVIKVNVGQNWLHCEGPSIASSESMSHAVIYEQCSWVNAIIHGHQLSLWQKLLYQVPTPVKLLPMVHLKWHMRLQIYYKLLTYDISVFSSWQDMRKVFLPLVKT